MTSPAPVERDPNRRRSSDQALRRLHRGERGQLRSEGRRDHRFPRPQRRGQVDDHPNPVRTFAAERRQGDRRGLRRRALPRAGAREYRLHVAEVLALQRSLGHGEPALLRRRLWGQGRAARGAAEVRHRHGGAHGPDGRARRRPFRRLEAAARAGLRGAARAGDPVPRRADLRRRSRLAPAVLGPHLFARRRGASASSSPPTTWTKPNIAIASRSSTGASSRRWAVRASSSAAPSMAKSCSSKATIPAAMLEALEGAPAVRDVAPFGSSLHIVVDDAARDRPAIETLLSSTSLAGRASSRSSRRSRTCSCSSSAATTRGGRAHESAPRQGDRQEGDHPGLARSAQPDGRAPDAADADGPARLRRQSRHQACADLRLRPRGKPAERVADEGLSGLALFQHRRDRARL